MISLSTCWNSHRQTDGNILLQEIAEMGFQAVELGHGTRITLMQGILDYAETGRLKFSSLHNYCPLPVEVQSAAPDCYTFTSHRQNERKRAIRLTKQTIDYAEQLGAQFVILHGGGVPMGRYTDKLIDMARAGKLYSKDYTRTKIRGLMERRRKADFYLERTLTALRELVPYAEERGVKLGLESRHDFEDIPLEEEFERIFDAIDSPHLGYWHDWGHSQIKHNLRLIDHKQWLEKWGPRALGSHLQDAAWPDQDHRLPFQGEIDFDTLLPLLPREAPLIWELSPRARKKRVLAAKEEWEKRYGA
jgi:sugar phosphate isomerase/epimerase